MAIILGAHQYGKAENRVVRIYRDSPRHEIHDVNVSTRAARRLRAPRTSTGDQPNVLPTDTQKNMAYAYAKKDGLELDRGLRPRARPALRRRRRAGRGRADRDRGVRLGARRWSTAPSTTTPSSARARRSGTASVTVEGTGDAQQTWVTGGFKDLVILKSTGSEFADFYVDEYTTLAADPRPRDGDVAGREVALHHDRRRLGRHLRRHQGDS